MEKQKTSFIFIAILVLIGAGAMLSYWKIIMTSPEQVSLPQNTVSYGGEENYFDFSGRITRIDLVNGVITAKIDLVNNVLSNHPIISEGKIYSFLVDERTKIYKIQYPKNFSADDFLADPAKFQKENQKLISAKDLKTGEAVDFYVTRDDARKEDNFYASKIIFRIF